MIFRQGWKTLNHCCSASVWGSAQVKSAQLTYHRFTEYYLQKTWETKEEFKYGSKPRGTWFSLLDVPSRAGKQTRTVFHEIFLLLVRPEILQEQLFSWYFGTFASGLAWSLEAEPCENPDGKSNFSQCVWSSAIAWKIHVLILYLCPAVTFRFKCFLTHTSFFCCCKLAASHTAWSFFTRRIWKHKMKSHS